MYYGEKQLLEMLKEHYKELNIKAWDAFYTTKKVLGECEEIECYALGEKTFYQLFVTRWVDNGLVQFQGYNPLTGNQLD